MNNSLRDELDKLLSENIDSAKKRENELFDILSGPFNKSIVLFGCGYMGRIVLSILRKKGIEPLAFADNNSSKWGTTIDGVRVLSPSDALNEFNDKAVFVITIWSHLHRYAVPEKQLEDLQCKRIIPCLALFWKYPDLFLPYYQIDLPHKILQDSEKVKKAYELFSENESRAQYLAQLRLRLLLDIGGLSLPSGRKEVLYSRIKSLGNNEIFVDCGAFDGDTIKEYLAERGSNFKRIVAYEPDPENFIKLKEYVSNLPLEIRNKIDIYKYALGKEKAIVCFDASGSLDASVKKNGSVEIECVSLDKELVKYRPSLIKYDIEGAESDALIGTKEIIKRDKPALAVSVYHRQSDLWELPLYISSLNSDYKYFLRMHQEDGFDLIAYAIPSSRIA